MGKFRYQNYDDSHHNHRHNHRDVEDDFYKLGKKAQRNLLLNFQYQAHAPQQRHFHSGSRRRHRSSNTITKTHAQYVLANYFFTLRPPTDSNITIYQSIKESPDPEIDDESIWDLIESVIIPVVVPDLRDKNSVAYNESFPRCPICLEQPPVCARVTKCGHVFCNTCLMRYLSYVEEHHLQTTTGHVEKKCPVCSEQINLNNCKSVEWRVRREVRAGQILEFDLVKRRKGDLIPTKVAHGLETEYDLFPAHGDPDAELSKFNIVSETQMMELLNREIGELQFAIATMNSSGVADKEEMSFLRAALRDVELRKHKWDDYISKNPIVCSAKFHIEEEVSVSITTSDKGKQTITATTSVSAEREAFGSDEEDHNDHHPEETNVEESDGEEEEDEESLTTDDSPETPEYDDLGNEMHKRKETNGKASSSQVPHHHMTASQYHKMNHMEFDSYYYYQISDNQMLFLHPLNTRCLIHEHQGDFTAFPLKIRAKVIQIEPTELTDELRRKIGVLSHVPLYCQFSFAEVDLSYNHYISAETRKHFSTDFYMRDKGRKDALRKKAREDRKARENEERERSARMAEIEERRSALSIDNFPEIEPTESVLKSDQHFPAPKASLNNTPGRKNSSGSNQYNNSNKKNNKSKNASLGAWNSNSIVRAPTWGPSLGKSSSGSQPDLQGHWKQKLHVPSGTNNGKQPQSSSSNSTQNKQQSSNLLDFPALSAKGHGKKK